MDLIRIGKYIQEKRKEKNLTQLQLAELLSVTDRAVSKWECGRSLPDVSIMPQLCSILDISLNGLLAGQDSKEEDYNRQAELNLLKVMKEKEGADRRLLRIETAMSFLILFSFLTLLFAGIFGYQYFGLPFWAMITMASIGFVQLITLVIIAIRIEQKAGYYECPYCHHHYVPSYLQVLLAPHINRTRYMKCPHCGKRSFQKKVISKTEQDRIS